MGVMLSMIYLSINLSLKPLITNLESPAKAYKAICTRYKLTEVSQQMHLFTLFFLLKMEDAADLHSHFDCIAPEHLHPCQ